MTIMQTVEIPDDHQLRLTIDIPREVPAGKAANLILTFPGVEPAAAPPEEREELDPSVSANIAAWRKFLAALKDTEPLPGDDLPPRWSGTRELPL